MISVFPTQRLQALFLFTFIYICSGLQAQNPFVSPTPGQDLFITSQVELDNFVNGNGKYTSSDVGITLNGTSTTFTDLGNLSELTSINGLLEIIGWGNDDAAGSNDPLSAFASLTFVQNLHVGRDIGNNVGMTAITSSTLIEVRNRLEFIRCINAQTVSLPNLTTLDGTLFMDSLTSATTIAFDQLPSVGQNLVVEDCHSLTDLSGFKAMGEVKNNFRLIRNDVLDNIDDLGSLVPGGRPTYSFRRLVFRDNQSLRNTLSFTATINKDVVIVNNGSLTDLGVLTISDDMEKISIGRNAVLVNTSGLLDGTTTLSVSSFQWYDNPAFAGASSRPLNVSEDIRLETLNSSTPFDFSPTTALSQDLNIAANPDLTDLSAFANLTSVGDFRVANNEQLTTLDDFSSLTTVTQEASITFNASLGDCCLFPEQVTVAGAPANANNPDFIVSGNTGDCADKSTVETSCAATFPVTWLSVTARQMDAGVLLEWETLEEDNERFVVERSTDGVRYAAVHSVAGRGTTTVSHRYRFLDRSTPVSPVIYYRLRQVDFDGASSLNRVVSVDISQKLGAGGTPRIYPNPSYGQPLRLSGARAAEGGHVSLYDALGRLRYHGEAAAAIPVANLPNGRYTVRIGSRNELTSLPVVLLR